MTQLSFTVRPFDANIDDPAEIARLHLQVRRGQVRDYNNVFSDILESQADLNAIPAYYIEPGGNFFVARDDRRGQIIGFVGIKLQAAGLGNLKRMAVVENFRRKGVGRALVQVATQWSAMHGFSKITLATGTKERARPIYEAVGFEVVGMIKDAAGNDKDYAMELDFGRLAANS